MKHPSPSSSKSASSHKTHANPTSSGATIYQYAMLFLLAVNYLLDTHPRHLKWRARFYEKIARNSKKHVRSQNPSSDSSPKQRGPSPSRRWGPKTSVPRRPQRHRTHPPFPTPPIYEQHASCRNSHSTSTHKIPVPVHTRHPIPYAPRGIHNQRRTRPSDYQVPDNNTANPCRIEGCIVQGLTATQMRDAWMRMRAVTVIPVKVVVVEHPKVPRVNNPREEIARVEKKVRWGPVEVFEYECESEVESSSEQPNLTQGGRRNGRHTI